MVSLKSPPAASKTWTRAWLVWVAAFFGIELGALLRRRPQDTLSHHVWAWFGIPAHLAPQRSVRVRRLALLCSLSWVAAHLLSGDEV